MFPPKYRQTYQKICTRNRDNRCEQTNGGNDVRKKPESLTRLHSRYPYYLGKLKGVSKKLDKMFKLDELRGHGCTMPRIRSDPITTTEWTKINVIEITLSEYTQDAVDLVLSTLGLFLNLSIVLLLALNSSLRVSTCYYAISLVGSSLVILIEPTRRILRSIFELNLSINLDYVFQVSFYSSILTIVMFSIENFIAACDRHASFYESYAVVSKATRRITIVWFVSILITAMELHLYEHFEKDDMHKIYAVLTIMFLVLSFITLLVVHSAILYELILLKSVEGQWRPEPFENFRLSNCLTITFLFTMVPYRIAKVTMALNPKATWCCSAKQTEILYFLIKTFPIACPMVCFFVFRKLREALQATVCSKCHKNVQNV